MEIRKIHRNDPEEARGVTVVIDVLRAFTTTAYAFASGAKAIHMVGTVDEAREIHKRNPSTLMMGEVEGEPIEGFHYENSPFQMSQVKLDGADMVMRTSSGTQGVIGATKAERILTSSFSVAQATFERLNFLNPDCITFVVTGRRDGSEDLALAEYLEEKLLGKAPSVEKYLEKVLQSPGGQLHASDVNPNHPRHDLEKALKVDTHCFAQEVFPDEDLLTLRAIDPLQP